MLKAFCKNLMWIAVPLGLAVGCASEPAASTAPTDPAVATLGYDETLAPTSSHAGSRVYADNNNAEVLDPSTYTEASSPTFSTVTDMNSAPPGANPQTWDLAQEIQWKLISDDSLAPMGSSLAAQVNNDGVVTLQGAVASTDEQKRVGDTISALPGVKSVNNQLKIGTASSSGVLDTTQQPQ